MVAAPHPAQGDTAVEHHRAHSSRGAEVHPQLVIAGSLAGDQGPSKVDGAARHKAEGITVEDTAEVGDTEVPLLRVDGAVDRSGSRARRSSSGAPVRHRRACISRLRRRSQRQRLRDAGALEWEPRCWRVERVWSVERC